VSIPLIISPPQQDPQRLTHSLSPSNIVESLQPGGCRSGVAVGENFNSSVLKTVCGRLSTAPAMRRSSFHSFRCGILLLVVLMTFLGVPLLQAQEQADAPKPVPVIIGGSGFIATFDGGEPHLGPLIAPVVLVPLGNQWLIESRTTFESDLTQRPGSSAFHGKVLKNVDYLQLDFIANPYLTVTVGRFLTPFGIFNERLYPIWIRNLQTDPLILPIAIGPSGASTGAMVRGGFQATSAFNVNYAAYFSSLSTIRSGSATPLDSDRSAGGRLGIFIPNSRLELGGSFQHLLQNERSNSFGFHGGWQPSALPLELRGEYEHSARGSGYWIEPAYRLSQVPFWQYAMRRMQLVARLQQYWVGELPSDSLPSMNTRQFEFGVNYYFRDGLRGVSSYGRQFSEMGNKNVWTIGLTYRFAFPLGHGDVN
jgi:hypothetical protein